MNSAPNSRNAHAFHGQLAEADATVVGYAWLVENFALRVPRLPKQVAISRKHRVIETREWLILTPRHAPADSLAGHLMLALKWEGVNLQVLAALAKAVPFEEFAAIVRAEPTGQYARRLWFLIEWLTGATLDLPDLDSKRAIVAAVDPRRQVALEGGNLSARHRVRNNLPGPPAFCPLVRITPELARLQSLDLEARARATIDRHAPALVARAAAFLQLSDSKASFAIEKETPSAERAQRWARAIARAGDIELSIAAFETLQRTVIEDDRFVTLGLRHEGGFVGEHDRHTGAPLPEHISARADDLAALMRGLIECHQRIVTHGMDPVVAAAAISFGFIYIHPFEDGNGRLHRWLIHHVLATTNYGPAGVVFPVSAAMERRLIDYRRVLEHYSRPLLDCIDWRATPKGNVEVLNLTGDLYRYFDATAHAEFLYGCVETTVEQDWPEELAYLEAYDRFGATVKSIVDMPDRTVDLLHRFLRQNEGRLSERARAKEFEMLTTDEVARVEAAFASGR